jgi:hypothetical protein
MEQTGLNILDMTKKIEEIILKFLYSMKSHLVKIMELSIQDLSSKRNILRKMGIIEIFSYIRI